MRIKCLAVLLLITFSFQNSYSIENTKNELPEE